MSDMAGQRPGAGEVGASLVARVFLHLSDGRFHSGEDLANTLGVSRSAVWKAARTLRSLGVTLHAVRNRGYRLARPVEPLDASRIRAALPDDVNRRLRRLDVAWAVQSTNTMLFDRPNPAVGTSEALLAEFQSAGRGRRGRSWLAPPGGAICLSMSWTFPDMPRDLGALGLAIGVCVRRALAAHGVTDLRLKWPNDLLLGDRKLGGILIELRAESSGPACVVIGIGLNLSLGTQLLQQLEQMGVAATDLASAGVGELSRNALAAELIACCVEGLLEFERGGLGPFVEEWRDADALLGRPIAVHCPDEVTRGIARGIDLTGALLVETPQGLKKFISGEVTVRPTP